MIKFNSFWIVLFSCILFISCHDTMETSPCLEERIAEFKSNPNAVQIIKMDTGSGFLYWFVDDFVDIGEEIVNDQCEVECITDCECTGIPYCYDNLFSYPQEIIWHK